MTEPALLAVREAEGSHSLARAREKFLSGTTPTGVRGEIVNSWRRSALVGARPEAQPSYGDPADMDGYLLASAAPVLDRLAERLVDSRVAMLLANRDALVIGRWAGDRDVLQMMDRTGSAPGFALREELVGTNGLGSVIEERRPLYVLGHEHFAEDFVPYACFGGPIEHPILQRLEGVLTLVCPADEASPLMLPFIHEISEVIQDRMLQRATARERVLLERFNVMARRTRHAALALNDRTIISNPAGLRLLDASDHALLWQSAAEATASRRRTTATIMLARGIPVDATFMPVEYDDAVVGALVELRQSHGRARSPHSPHHAAPAGLEQRLSDGLAGRSKVWVRTLRDVAAVVSSPEPVLVCGPRGSGKTRVARVAHDVSGRPTRLAILDAAMVPVDGSSVWLGLARQVLQEEDDLLVRHLDLLDERTGGALVALAESASGQGSRLLATITLEPEMQRPRTPHVDWFAVHEIRLPRLENRAEDVPELVRRILSEMGRADLRLSSEALQAATRAPWPGNVRQLERMLRAAAGRCSSRTIGLADLPTDLLESSRRQVGRLEEVERRAIVEALANAEGNKKAAADELGISRSTLYRKLRAFGMDLDRAAF